MWKKVLHISSAIVLCLLYYLHISKPVNAIELTGGNALELSSGTMLTDGGTVNAIKSRNDLILDSTNALVYGLNFDYSNSTIPSSDYLLTFDVTYISTFGSMPASGLPNVRYDGLESETMNKLAESCTVDDTGSYYEGSVLTYRSQTIYHCSYLFFSHAGYTSFSSVVNSRIYAGFNEIRLIVSPGFLRGINFNSLTENDRDWLEDHMPAGSSTADIESAIESAREDEKSEYEEQQEDVDSGADDAGQEAEEATSTLIDTGRNIIETIRDTPATNCVIRIKSGAFDTGNLNLCNVPQQIRTVISTVITIPVTLSALHIAYSVVMLYLNTVRKEQE